MEENAEFEDAERQIEFVEVRIREIKQLIKTLEKNATGVSSKNQDTTSK